MSIPSLFPHFKQSQIDVNGVTLNYVMAGEGPPLLLLHGHPQTLAIWHKVAGELAKHFTVVAADLRGYGDSSKPEGAADHSTYSKRSMAKDSVELMQKLGFDTFHLCGHDRGGRTGHRLAIDHPNVLRSLTVLDIAPTLAMYEKTDIALARSYFHWFLMLQPAPLPERLIGADPEFWLKSLMGGRHAGLKPFTPEALAEYVRCIKLPGTVHALCEDYRASGGIDLDHDRQDREAGLRIKCPVLALWGSNATIERCFDAIAEWSAVADDVRGASVPCGHYIAEEQPELLIEHLLGFIEER